MAAIFTIAAIFHFAGRSCGEAVSTAKAAMHSAPWAGAAPPG
jgi:hypothetical protein